MFTSYKIFFQALPVREVGVDEEIYVEEVCRAAISHPKPPSFLLPELSKPT